MQIPWSHDAEKNGKDYQAVEQAKEDHQEEDLKHDKHQ